MQGRWRDLPGGDTAWPWDLPLGAEHVVQAPAEGPLSPSGRVRDRNSLRLAQPLQSLVFHELKPCCVSQGLQRGILSHPPPTLAPVLFPHRGSGTPSVPVPASARCASVCMSVCEPCSSTALAKVSPADLAPEDRAPISG